MNRANPRFSFAHVAAPALVILAIGTTSVPASAESTIDNAATGIPAPASRAETPKVQEENGISYLVGGIGQDGREAIRPLVGDMNLRLVFAEQQSGAYLADIDVKIADASGRELLTLDSSDPLVFAQLEPGTYDIVASSKGRVIERRVTVTAEGVRTETLLWT